MQLDVPIIFPTKNRLWSLPKAVASCRKRKFKTQIIVMDDASPDGTIGWLKTQTDLKVENG